MTDADGFTQLLDAERTRINKVRERHAREVGSMVADTADISRETYRKCKAVLGIDGAADSIRAGHASIDSVYRLSKGDESVGINIRVPFELRERIKTEAAARGVTMADLLVDYLTQIFG